LSTVSISINGNGKIDRTPSPVGLRKIKRVGFKVFLGLKELLYSVKVNDSITPRGNRKKSILRREYTGVIIQQRYVYEYEPSNMINAYDNTFWRWRRVTQWDQYLNDPVEKIKGHMIT